MRSTTRNMIGVAATAALALGLAACGSDEGDGGGDDNAAEGDNIVVTLWRPHWAYDEFPIRDLEDPEGTLGDAESIHTFANPDFVAENEQVAEWLRNFTMDGDTLHSLENVMFNENPDADDYQPIVEEWVADNQEYVDGLIQ